METLVLNLSLRAKFLVLSAVVQALVVALLIWNSLRLMDDAVGKNAERVAHEYAVTLNLSLSPYAINGKLGQLSGYLAEMLADPEDSFLRYIVILDAQGRPIIEIGGSVAALPPALRAGTPGAGGRGARTVTEGQTLHARAPLLLQDNQVGTLNFGLSTTDLKRASDEVMLQGGAISLAGFVLGLGLFYLFTHGIGRRLAALTGQSRQMAHGQPWAEQGGDEIDMFSRSLASMSAALRERVAQLEQSERRLVESESRFKILFDMAPLPLSVSDHEGRVIAANQALARTFDYPVDSLIGMRSDQVTFWASAVERDRIWNIYQSDGAVHGAIAGVCLPDGSVGSVAIWSSSLVLDGRPAIIWALLDLSEELNAKRELKDLNISLESRVRERSAALELANRDLSVALENLQRTQDELLAAEKMASLGSLVAGIAHELNTPIGNSLLASTTLGDRVNEFEALVEGGALRRSELRAHMEEVRLASNLISGSLHKAADLISSFKQVAVDQTNDQRRSFDLLTVVQDTLATYTPRLRQAGCAAHLAIPPGLTLDSYPGSLYQILNNLINNTLAHAFERGIAGNITISAAELGQGQVELVFADDGAGMPDEVLRRVFDPFFTTKMGQGGTGLGMHIVYNIVTGMLGGRIAIESAPGRGTTVRMALPRCSPQRS
ncbi:PAS domain S-box-containing protein [Rugamonas rubra]|uniref:histidine kinase n=1 Tax=Rugamonas rubra TaxID=758825 RepID=A0A1I4N4X4_9BURK|nr:PAS domain S-box-containing protein [Rugamonas rubra]